MYATSILEDYIRTTFSIVAKLMGIKTDKFKKIINGVGVSKLMNNIKKEHIKHIGPFPEKGGNKFIYHIVFLARLRNCIVHNDGKPDNDFWQGRNEKEPTIEELLSEPLLSLWNKNCGNKATHAPQLWLDVKDVVLPLLDDAIAFVDSEILVEWGKKFATKI